MRRLVILTLTVLVVAMPARALANTVPNWDRHFLLETAEGAHFEITMGKIAARKGHSRARPVRRAPSWCADRFPRPEEPFDDLFPGRVPGSHQRNRRP